MASFTFGTGNARKIVGLPLYVLGALIGIFVPRSRRVWVFGSGIGLGEGALPLYERARERFPDHRIVWMARTKSEFDRARARGLTVVRKNGLRGFWTTLRARVVVVTHGFGDANRFGMRGAFVVQLWHGLPFKHLHLDSPSTYRVALLPNLAIVRGVLGRAYRRAGAAISLFPVASERVKPSIVSGFGVHPRNVVVLGDIRDDVLLEPGAAQRAEEAVLDMTPPAHAGAKRILFAPTWRDGAADPTVPTQDDWRAIARWLDDSDAVLFVRNHPLGRGDYTAGPGHSSRIVPLTIDLATDLNPLLPAIDAIVTDYSSIVFDYALLGRPVVHFTPDLAAYTSSRGFYMPVEEFTGRQTTSTWAETLDTLSEALAEDADGPAHRHADHLRQEFFDVLTFGAADRVIDAVVSRIDPKSPAPEPAPVVARPTVTDLSFHDRTGTLMIAGINSGSLVGRRARVDAVDWTFPLLQSRWGSDPLALPSGTYRLELPDGSTRVNVVAEPLEIRHPMFHASVRAEAGGLLVEVRAPLDDTYERGPEAQKSLEAAYRRDHPQPEDAVFFESFRGRSTACNPRALDRVIADERPNTVRYWSVADGSVEVPIGAVRVIEGSRAWWRARASARVLVVNDWLRKRWRRRPHQHVLQTWHGSTLKRLARDRPDAGLRTREAARREGKRWDALLAQNEFSASNLRTAYAFRGPVWVDGYPRTDALARSFHHNRAAFAIYAKLGINPDQRVALWAPTWREDRETIVDHLDVDQLASLLGPEWTVLVRGHISTWLTGTDRSSSGVLDVTTYPDVSDLLQVTDVLITDYSSVMFDWLVTDRPIVFCVPDLARYAQELRGFYADLLADAPGPIVRTTSEVADAVLNSQARAADFADTHAAWRERFAPKDDGRASERVLERIHDAGWLNR